MNELVNRFDGFKLLEIEQHLTVAMNRSCAGMVCEFGVWKGRSLRHIAKRYSGQKVYGFDTFTGLPEPWVRSDTDTYEIGHFGTTPMNTDKYPNIELVIGDVKDTLPGFIKEHQENAGFLHIDTDLYSSAVNILTNWNDFIVPGTVLVFDELHDGGWGRGSGQWYANWREGEYKALLEWIGEYDRCVEPIGRAINGSGSVVVTK